MPRLLPVALALSLLLNAFFVAGFVFRSWIAPLPFEQRTTRVGLFDWLFARDRRFALPRLATMTAAVIIAFSGFMLGGGLGESMAQERYAYTQASNDLTEFLVSDGI